MPSQMRGRLAVSWWSSSSSESVTLGRAWRKLLDRPVVDRRVTHALKHHRRLGERRLERIVAERVLVERDVERPLFAVGVVEERERAGPPPFLDAFGRQQMMTWLGEHDGRRQQHEAIDAIGEAGRGQNRQRPAEARSDQRRRGGRAAGVRQLAVELAQHPGHRERREVRLVEVRAAKRHAQRREPLAEVRRPWSIAPTTRSRAGRRPGQAALRSASGIPARTGT